LKKKIIEKYRYEGTKAQRRIGLEVVQVSGSGIRD